MKSSNLLTPRRKGRKDLFCLGELCSFRRHYISRYGKKKEVRVSSKAAGQKDLYKRQEECGSFAWRTLRLCVRPSSRKDAKNAKIFLGIKFHKSFYKTGISYFFCPLATFAPWRELLFSPQSSQRTQRIFYRLLTERKTENLHFAKNLDHRGDRGERREIFLC